ncbi:MULTISPECIES: LacI family DNA-binding transcriptional regulator [Cryobacterium]|uniref:LacI family transcriptional regulator n=1 Tax=Cryobacterium glucosi TaxID=1259175 RepID=A0ABY2IRL5_9MICO|nr:MULTISPECIES: LacI family DNA-binding transcriptional regulator [Cryobacterium]TFB98837.1 LacI family transcriptional regulator [Cryobacterium sp. MDB2-A-1]TFC04247.1 LacI family transcriptional regulator [Cryobacterium sp. MDB2-33-2]TFC14912.1 LacI family transcriptional regulator [Cryobacterium sp. MDB2-A-2]TFC16420.1 LacI family transcriptional regulator [Cryobacterium sp. MDB2-10]TFC21145.1 LacI family transcriptional regulator [Cryobacterium glucosi]
MDADRDNEEARPRAASVFDVARVAGVSHQTVSRVLNDHPSLRAATRQKVLDAMRELNYRPNAAARALSSSRSRLIGILSTSSGEYGPATIVAAIGAAARSRGYSVTIANADGLDRRSVDDALSHLADLSAEGLIVVAPQTQVLVALEGLTIPVPYVTLQTAAASGLHGGMLDQIRGARLATSHLLDLGHQRVGHIAGPPEWLDAQQRLTGFQEELRSRQLDPRFVEIGDWSAASGHRAARALIEHGVTAIFSGNDQMALGALSAAVSLGLTVPGDLSIVGFDDVPEAAYYQPALTTVRQDLAEAGRRAVALLLGEADVRPAVGPELIERASTGAPPERPRPEY